VYRRDGTDDERYTVLFLHLTLTALRTLFLAGRLYGMPIYLTSLSAVAFCTKRMTARILCFVTTTCLSFSPPYMRVFFSYFLLKQCSDHVLPAGLALLYLLCTCCLPDGRRRMGPALWRNGNGVITTLRFVSCICMTVPQRLHSGGWFDIRRRRSWYGRYSTAAYAFRAAATPCARRTFLHWRWDAGADVRVCVCGI